MEKTIFFFVKFFKEKKHAQDFIEGKLYLNTLSYFRSYEDKNNAICRGDKYEAAVGWFQPREIKLEINGIEIDSNDLASPVLIQMNWHGKLNIFCMYCSHNGSFESIKDDEIELFLDQIRINEDCREFGDYAVIIGNSKEFLNRVVKASELSQFEIKMGMVQYYDPETFNGKFKEYNSAFNKRKEYEYQSEYRIVINSKRNIDEPIVIEIGDLRDIAYISSLDQINKGLGIKLPIDE